MHRPEEVQSNEHFLLSSWPQSCFMESDEEANDGASAAHPEDAWEYDYWHKKVLVNSSRHIHLYAAMEHAVLVSIKKWGATGVLLEWEDTFPFQGELASIGSQGGGKPGFATHSESYLRSDHETTRTTGSGGDGMYSAEEVQQIFQFAENLELEAIQLIQTIGHMEYVLKHPAFRGLREHRQSPAALCPSHKDALTVVKAMVEQALRAQPAARYFHIGADEVWHMGVCESCKFRASQSEYKTASLYLDHVRDISTFVKQSRPGINVLMWDDMLRTIPFDTLKAYKLSEVVQPVVWNYNPKECFNLDSALWGVYSRLFHSVWAGSAYKGANGSCKVLSPVMRYVSNNDAWKQEISKYQKQVHFAGIILTGWSRFDHYATLCELLAVSLPSLASCLRVYSEDGNTNTPSEVLPSGEWPGEEVARCVHSFAILRERCHTLIHGDMVTTWLNPWQLEHDYINPMQIEGLAYTARNLLNELTSLKSQLRSHLHAITGRRSTDEWTATFVSPLAAELTDVTTKAEQRMTMDASVLPTGY